MSAREEIMAGVRRALHVSGAEAPRQAAVADRLAKSPVGVIPARGQGGVETFKAEATRAAASLSEIAAPEQIPAEIARFLRDNNLPATLRLGADPRLDGLPWGETSLEIAHGPSDGSDLNGLSVAFAGIAETGTLALVSGADNPTTLNFLPDNHLVVIFAKDVVGDMEQVFARLRLAYGAGQAPRTLNFVTGPSRSADIEQTLLFGAHGPRRLHIVLVGQALPNLQPPR
jgi:L-lactate dehydrogenase complex protein LldG